MLLLMLPGLIFMLLFSLFRCCFYVAMLMPHMRHCSMPYAIFRLLLAFTIAAAAIYMLFATRAALSIAA